MSAYVITNLDYQVRVAVCEACGALASPDSAQKHRESLRCKSEATRRRLAASGFVPVVTALGALARDLGAEVIEDVGEYFEIPWHVETEPRVVPYVPAYVHEVFAALPASALMRDVLARAVKDAEFRGALLVLLRTDRNRYVVSLETQHAVADLLQTWTTKGDR